MPKPTKKQLAEQARIAHEIQEVARISAALRWTDATDTEPDVPPPEGFGDKLTTGWTYNVYSRRVDVACSSSVFHAVGQTDRTTSQGRLRLYSTRLRALRALRVAMEQQFAQELAKIDGLIEQEG